MSDDKELYESAIADTPAETAEAPVETTETKPEAVETAGQPRDEHGRWLPKVDTDEPEQAVEAQPAPVVEAKPQEQPKAAEPEQHRVPLRELLDERERRQELQRALQAMQTRLQQLEKPKETPDFLESPDAFVQQHAETLVNPVKSEVEQLREFYSRRDAVREFGEETVNTAFAALHQAAVSGDPEAQAAVARVKASMHPFGDIVTWHKKQTVFSTIGADPDAWFEKQIGERAKDPAFKEKLLGMIGAQAPPAPAPQGGRPASVVQLPPSLNRVAASAPRTSDGDSDTTDAGLYRHATR